MIDEDNADLAIVGIACRFPGARNSEEFWRNLAAGVESIVPLSDEQILAAGVPEADLKSPSYVKAAAMIAEPGGFDAPFFGFVPGEARTMDPQQRLLLELAHTALEDAGCDPARYPGRVGVFAGSAMNTYFMHARLDRQFAHDYIPTLIVNDKDFLSTRVSYKLNLKGPSLTVQTACSTSLVAVHLARQSLLSEETDMAIAGAVSVRAPHEAGYLADSGGVSSPDGHVRAFDAAANGTVFGSGGGVIVLKRLRDAVADGDTIRAIIKGSAINNDGAEKAGYTAPSVNSQADAIVEALANADVDAETISYVEAHGSGTPVGDPIEIRALTKAFRSSTQRTGFCAIGSVKTNVGHLDAAAGMAGLIKTVLAMQHGQIPASLHYSRPNPEIDFPSTPFFVNASLSPWAPVGVPRRAGIMSTGMGGTNAHVVLEEAPAIPQPAATPGPALLVLSARTESALTASSDNLRRYLEEHPAVRLSDVANTLQTGRRAMLHRRFVVASDLPAAITALAAAPKRLNSGKLRDGARRPIAMLLPGVGDHYVGMGRELYQKFPAFRREVDRCADILRPLLGQDIREILYPRNRDWSQAASKAGLDLKKMLAGNVQAPEDEDSKRLNQATLVQPALFAIEYALACLWKDLGVVPDALIGHSMGEYVAACLSGVFSLEDALRLIVRRTQLADTLPPASMLAVPLPEPEVKSLIGAELSIALINGPSLCVVAGPAPAIEEFKITLTARGVICRAVQNTHAFHSRVLDPVIGAFEAEVRKARLNRPTIPFISNVTGKWITDAEAVDPAYWAKHLNHTARFNDALATMWQLDGPVLLEAGPGKTLGVLTNQHPAKATNDAPLAVWSLRHHYENQSDSEILLNSAGRLWVAGTDIQWNKLPTDQHQPPRKIPLPTYPFERQNYWIEPKATPSVAAEIAPPPSREIEQWFYTPAWERTVFPTQSPADLEREQTLWLVLSNRPDDANDFQLYLKTGGHESVLAHFGERLQRQADDSFTIAPGNPEDYLQLFRAVQERTFDALRIIHLGCVQDAEPELVNIQHAQDAGFYSLLFIAQAIGELHISTPVSIGVISSHIHEVTGDEQLNPLLATALGPCSVIPKELPNVTCFQVDLADSDLRGRIPRIVSEFAHPPAGETIAYRGKHRWKRTFQQVSLPPQNCVPKRLRQGGVYLITGGAGGLGLSVARYLAESCQAKLVLTKRSPFMERTQWDKALADQSTPPATIHLIQEIRALEQLGAEVEVMVAEVSDLQQMQVVLRQTLQRFQSLHGVIHAAGIARAGLIQTTTRKVASAMLSPKMDGTLVLHQILQGIDLDFLVLYSSMASITGPFAHVDYSAANAFLDAFAAYSNSRRSYHTLAINWPVWKEVGMVAKLEAFMGVEDWREEALRKAILTSDGLEAFRRILDSDLPQAIVSPEDLDQVLAQFNPAGGSATQFPGIPASKGAVASNRTALSPTEEPTDEIEAAVAEIWGASFGIPQIGIRERFTELGGHSLLALQIVTRIRAMYGVDIALRDFFEASTILQLSALIRDRLIADIANLSDEEVQQLIASDGETHE